MQPLRAPFPYFGGKSSVAPVVWDAYGDVPNLVEPFFGSGALLLARPDRHEWWKRTETINDLDGLVSNFWRAVQQAPDDVAHYADWPVSENDLHARHAWLVARKDGLQQRLEGAHDYFDAQIAGWWVWGICQWIGSGWCSGKGPWRQVDGELVNNGADRAIERKRPSLINDGRGINRKLVHPGDDGRGINRKRVRLGGWSGTGVTALPVDARGEGTCEIWSGHLRGIMQRLSDRLRRVRICSGDWSRVCGPTPTFKLGTTGVFLDPPYSHAERQSDLYRVEMQVATAVRDWAVEQGEDPRMRIALCGYEGEYEMPATWTAYRWKSKGGYGSQGGEGGEGRLNSERECIWFSPHCVKPTTQQRMKLA